MATRYVSVSGGGLHDGTSEANAWTLAEATANVSAGDIVYCKAGTYEADDSASSSVMDVDVAGTVSSWVQWIAYTTTIDDFTPGDTPPVILDASTNTLTNAAQSTTIGGSCYNRFEGFEFTGASGDGFGGGTTSDELTFLGCKFDSNGDRGLQGDDNIVCVMCEFTGNTTGAFDGDNDIFFFACTFHNEASTTVLSQQASVYNCLFYNNGNGINVRATGFLAGVGNSFDGDNQASSVGFETSGSSTIPHLIFNNIFWDMGTGVNFANAGVEHIRSRGFNLFSSCTTNYDNISDANTDIDDGTTDPFTNSGTRDYTLASGSTALEAGLDAQGNPSYIDMGALQKQPSGSGGGLITHPGMNGGING